MFKKVIFTGAMLVSALSAHAAGSAPFGVTGTITPAACDVTLTGGVINLGTISTVLVRTYGIVAANYGMPQAVLPFNITCSAPSHVEVSFVDNHAGKNFVLNGNDAIRFGIVDGTGTAAIGSYQAHFANMLIDGAAVGAYFSAANGTTAWSTSAPSSITANWIAPGFTNGFGKLAAATTPDSLTTLVGNLLVDVYLSSAYIQTATSAITPNGSGTMSLVYL